MSDIYASVTQRLNKLALLHRIVMRPKLQEQGLYRGQPPVLHYLLAHEGCTQAEIAAAMGISPASIAKTLACMERGGLIERRPDEADRRANVIRVTKRGLAAEAGARAAFTGLDEQLYGGIGEERLKHCASTLEMMIVNLTGKPSDAISLDELVTELKTPEERKEE